MYRWLIEDLETILEKGAQFRHFSNVEAKRIGNNIGVDWDEVIRSLGELDDLRLFGEQVRVWLLSRDEDSIAGRSGQGGSN